MNGLKTEIINRMVELFSNSKDNYKHIMDMKHYIILKETDSNQIIINKSVQNLMMYFKIDKSAPKTFDAKKEELFDDFVLFINLSIKKLRKEDVKEAYSKFIAFSESQSLSNKEKIDAFYALKNFVAIRKYSRK